ncbi:MAG: tripartite tricarboxylate transporter substrate binding protein [Betaproteobacteria bacterium]|nr:tripartite tricarboxylate transporter substrate binding protein [Betaproteobacteria bacterium]
MLAQKISEQLSQPVVVENRPGASTAIATERVATSPADGYTLLLLPSSTSILSALRAKLPYDLERDFAPVSRVSTTPLVLIVHPSVPARNVKELIALARSHPGKLSHASEGVGTAGHLAGELFKSMAKVDILHVPYKGGSEISVAAASGQVDMGFPDITSALSLLGKVRWLAVTTEKRSALKPSIPTLSESGLRGYVRSGWTGVIVPAGVPKNIIAQLHAVIDKIVNSPETTESLNKLGLEPQASTPEQFAAFIRSEIAQNTKLIESAKIKVE